MQSYCFPIFHILVLVVVGELFLVLLTGDHSYSVEGVFLHVNLVPNKLLFDTIAHRPLIQYFQYAWYLWKIRFMPPQLREIGFHVQNHATQWHEFQHEIQFQEVGVAWIQLTLV